MAAWEANLITLPNQQAGGDLSTKQFYLVKHSAGKIAVTGTKGEFCLGVLQDDPSAADRSACVAIGGVSKCVAGEAIAADDLICAGANGKAFVATKGRTNTSDAGAAADPLIGSYVIGIALEAAAAEDVLFPLLILHAGAVATTAA